MQPCGRARPDQAIPAGQEDDEAVQGRHRKPEGHGEDDEEARRDEGWSAGVEVLSPCFLGKLFK